MVSSFAAVDTASACLYSGLVYLSGMVTYSLVLHDIPAVTNGSPAAQEATLDYYRKPSQNPNWTNRFVVPVACVLLTTGVFLHV